jgi:hypothetical protein
LREDGVIGVLIRPRDEHNLRLYQSGKALFPSVTEVLKITQSPYIEQWWRRVGQEDANRVLESATRFGKRLHVAAEHVAWGRWDEVDEDLRPYARAVRRFIDEHLEAVLETELELVSPRLRFGGTLDLYCRLKDGALAVVDYKTGPALTREHGLQLAAYALLCREAGMTVNRRLGVRIKRDKPGEFYVRHYDNDEQDVRAFLGLLDFWFWRHEKQMENKKKRR